MKKLLFVLSLVAIHISVSSQQLARYEYWFDHNSDNRVQKSSSDSIIDIKVNTNGLSTGIHSFSFRAVDSEGRWSSPFTSYFLHVPSGTAAWTYEYWFDSDHNHRVKGQGTGDMIELDVRAQNLSIGIHSFNFRAKDEAGRWSVPVTAYFMRLGNDLDPNISYTYEYWIDEDSHQKVSGTSADGLINLNVNARSLKAGIHCLAFRIKDNRGRWGSPICHYFVKPFTKVENPITAYYYWFNGHVEDAQLVRLSQPASPLLLDVDLPTNNISQEVTRENITILTTPDDQQQLAMKNVLAIQFLDERGQWSETQVDTFAVAVGNRVVSLTPFIVNPEADEQWNGWTIEGNRSRSIQNRTPWNSASNNNYFCIHDKDMNRWHAQMKQTVSGLPAGNYFLSAIGRTNTSTVMSLIVNGYRTEFPAVDAVGGELWEEADENSPVRQANDGKGSGWSKRTVAFSTNGDPFDIIVDVNATDYQQWADIDGFELTVNGTADKAGTVSLRDVQIASISNELQWNELGQSVMLNLRGFYANKKGRQGTIYYSVDNGTTVQLVDGISADGTFEKEVECFFRENTSPHTISLYGKDTEGVISERAVIEIGNLNRGCSVEKLPQVAIYTGESITIDSLIVRDNRTGQLISPDDYTVTYINNVDDGVATITLEGIYPNWLGRKEVRFNIKSYIDDAEIAVLRTLYEKTLGDSLWYRKWDIQKEHVLCDEFMGITARNRHVTAINLANNNLTGEIPTGLLALPALKTLHLENNRLKGIVNTIGISSSLKELYMANNRLWGLNGAIPATVDKLTLNKQTIDEVGTFHLTASGLEAQMQQLPNIGLYDHQQQNFTRNADITMMSNGYNDPTLAILSQRDGEWQLRIDEWGSRTYLKESGNTVYCRDDAQNRFMIKLEYDAGDANFDGMVNIQDLSTTIMYCLKNYFATFNYGAANLWQDEIINIQDAVCLVNILLDGTPPQATASSHTNASRRSTNNGMNAAITCSDGRLTLSSPVPVSAFDVLIGGTQLSEITSLLEPKGFLVSMRQQSDGVHLVGYSPSGSLLPAGNSTVAEVKSRHPRVTAALLADDKARAVSVMGTEADGISEIAESAMSVVLGKGTITVTSANVLNNVSWTLQGVNGAIIDSGHATSLPAGVNSMTCKSIRHGVYVLRLTADGQRPIVKKISMR